MLDNESEKEHEANLKRLKALRPLDDTLMRRMFKNNIPLTEKVLGIILEKPDLKVISVETQVDLKRVTGARSLCLDAEAVDLEGNRYDIEVQKSNAGAKPKRARYHSSVMDIENLSVNDDFEKLPETYVIMITEKDVYREGKAVYQIDRMNLATGKLFGDKAHIIYVNGAFEGDDEIGRLMHDFRCSDPHEMFMDLMRERALYYKETEKGVNEMCQIMEDMLEEERIKLARNFYEAGASLEMIAQACKCSIELVKEWLGLSVA